MPHSPNKPCSRPGCNTLTRGRFCEEHKRQHTREQEAKRPPGRAEAYGDEWRKLTKKILRDNPLCVRCHKQAQVVHHMKRWRRGGKTEPGNLQALCKRCHDRITATQDGGFGRG